MMLVDVMCGGRERSAAFIGYTSLQLSSLKHLCKPCEYQVSAQVFENIQHICYLILCVSLELFMYHCVWKVNNFF